MDIYNIAVARGEAAADFIPISTPPIQLRLERARVAWVDDGVGKREPAGMRTKKYGEFSRGDGASSSSDLRTVNGRSGSRREATRAKVVV